MGFLTKADILAAEDLPRETVRVPEWGGEVLVRGLTGAQRDEFEASVVVGKGSNREVNIKNLRAKLVSLSVVDEAGALLFTDKDIDALGKKSAVALQRVFEVAQRVSGLTSADVDELSKNSEGAQSDGSTSD
jgi:hypothetical protein